MTAQEAKSKLVTLALSEVGYREGENNYNKYAAELDPLGATWGAKQNMPWCGEFVIWLFYKCFGLNTGLKMMYSGKPTSIPACAAGAEYYKRAGKWYTNGPEVGDVIFFYYSGGINHTGVVVSVSGGVVTTVEGNSSDKVSRNSYGIGSTAIAGYGRPDWSLVANAAPAPATPEPTPGTPVLKPKLNVTLKLSELSNGDTGEEVRYLQTLLPFHGSRYKCGVWGADGEFGNATQNAVEKFQKDKGLVVDSIVGQATWTALHKIG